LRIDLQVQALGGDQRNKQLIDIKAVPAEHAPRAHRASRAQQLSAVA
jgi:hypothetical protein